jgi:lipopolysaccharide export system permease protein
MCFCLCGLWPKIQATRFAGGRCLNGIKLIIDRYIIREIVKPTVAICSALIFIYGCFMGTRYLSDAVSGQIPGSIVIILILLRISISLEVLLPTTLYLSVIIAMGRLYKDSEMTALSACGVSTSRVLRPVFLISLVIAVIVSSLSLYIRPWAYDQFFRIKGQAKANFDLTRMKSGTFYEIENGRRVIFADEVDQSQIKVSKVFIRTQRDDDKLQVIQASRASQHTDPVTGKQILVFTDGYLHEFSRFGTISQTIEFEKSAMSLEPRENEQQEYKIKATATGLLARSDNNEEIAEFQWRLSTPLATILLALLGVPLSRSSPRRGKYAKVMTAVLIIFVYHNLGAVAKKMVIQGFLGTMPGIWWVQILLTGLLLILLRHSTRGFRL